jgi:hypothetical protein
MLLTLNAQGFLLSQRKKTNHKHRMQQSFSLKQIYLICRHYLYFYINKNYDL